MVEELNNKIEDYRIQLQDQQSKVGSTT
ncbi:unnamed protein product, partial [Rotaria magnacalcarata]